MSGMPGMSSDADSMSLSSARMILPMIRSPMLPGLAGAAPDMTPFLPGAGRSVAALPEGVPSTVLRPRSGDTITLEATLIRRTLRGHTFAMYGYNGEYPGPLIDVAQGTTLFVRFRNRIDLPSTVHWHGVRVDNRYDGAAGVTQAPVAPGDSFLYVVHFPDAGIFWYHDHVREDIAQPMGLFGDIRVESADDADRAVDADAYLMLSDVLLGEHGPLPFGRERANFALMGRFGTLLLVNGVPRYERTAQAGDVIRFYITNASSARIYNLSFGGAPMKLVGSDQGRFEREVMVKSVLIAPAERYVVDVRFPSAGTFALLNRVQAIDHFLGEFYAGVDTLGIVHVEPGGAGAHSSEFDVLHDDAAVRRDIDPYRAAFGKPPDEEVVLTTEIHDLPIPVMQFLSVDTMYRPPIEWTDGMADMNWLATQQEVRWIIRDRRSGAENMAIHWRFRQGDVVKVRIFNDPRSLHPMDHPIHVHGQRFLVIARDGRPVTDLVWKDTAIIPVGSTVDILIDASNPGTWMLHCHIAEHLQAGMMTAFTVDRR